MSNTILTTVESPHFGRLEVNEHEVIRLLAPLVPFRAQHFLLLGKPEETPFLWLQAVDEPVLALVVAPYEVIAGEPAPALQAWRRGELGLAGGEAPEAYLIVSLDRAAGKATVNLLAPVYLCRRTLLARQIIGDGSPELTRVPLF
jgi:flagellar assembly factor FliW